jgi:hypothetical protein
MERIFLGAATLSALLLIAGAASATQDVLLTAVKGDASVQDRALTEHDEVGDDQKLQTGDDAGCSVLVDRNAVVELCGQTRISFAKHPKRGNRIVNVESGNLRLIVEPREANERIEIHTPAAIATILGTVVYVSVDPLTGATTISSSDSTVNIRGQDEEECTPRGLPAEPGLPECAEGTTIGSLEQLTIVPGERRQSAKKLSRRQIDALGGCLLDFHDLALDVDRLPQETKAAERAVAVDVAAVSVEDISAPIEPTVAVEAEAEAEVEVEVELEPTDDPAQEDQIMEDMMMMMTDPDPDPVPPCDSIPGEHC